ncbi:hypothetical protein HYX13_01630 [Candidatus Woesearchaeota archaeon]|nr:hypothetical protein [Candidatus Woesearchaeota archaeon]
MKEENRAFFKRLWEKKNNTKKKYIPEHLFSCHLKKSKSPVTFKNNPPF